MMTAAIVGLDFVISDELDDRELATALARDPNTDPFKSLGAVRSLNISFWGYCVGYDAPTYNNDTVDVCFSFDDKITMPNLVTTDGCVAVFLHVTFCVIL